MGTARTKCHDCEGHGEKLREKDRYVTHTSISRFIHSNDQSSCKKCKGEKTNTVKSRQEIFVEKGMKDKQPIVLAGAGDQEVRAILIYVTFLTCLY